MITKTGCALALLQLLFLSICGVSHIVHSLETDGDSWPTEALYVDLGNTTRVHDSGTPLHIRVTAQWNFTVPPGDLHHTHNPNPHKKVPIRVGDSSASFASISGSGSSSSSHSGPAPIINICDGDAFPGVFSIGTAVGTYFPLKFGAFVKDIALHHSNGTTEPLQRAPFMEGCLAERNPAHCSSYKWCRANKGGFAAGAGAQSYDLVNISYSLDLRAAMEYFTSIGQLVGAPHVQSYHTLLQMYGVVLLPPRFSNPGELLNAKKNRVVLHAEGVEPLPHGDGWHAYSPLFVRGMIAKDVFSLLDTPLISAKGNHVEIYSWSATQQHLIVFRDTADNSSSSVGNASDLFSDQLEQAQMTAATALSRAGLCNMSATYHVIWELVQPSGNTGWALEHNSCFQAMDNNTAQYDQIVIDFQATHHETHSHFIPRRLYTDKLRPDQQALGVKSSFIFFSEGWAQFLAFQMMCLHGPEINRKDCILAMAHRFGLPVLREYAKGNASKCVGVDLLSLSLQQYEDQSCWFFNFAAGALTALLLDFYNAASLGSELIQLTQEFESAGYLHERGLPEENFAGALETRTTLKRVHELFDSIIGNATFTYPVEEWFKMTLGLALDADGQGFHLLPNKDIGPNQEWYRIAGFGYVSF